jgi:hypothetical protein
LGEWGYFLSIHGWVAMASRLFSTSAKTIKSCLTFNYGEFGIIKIGSSPIVVENLPFLLTI